MVKLNIDSINSSAPYRVAKDESTGFYVFSTRYGIEYGVRFDEDELLGAKLSDLEIYN